MGRLFIGTSVANELPDAPESEHGLHGPAYLLIAGYAIEAMLKAAAVQIELNVGGVDRVVTGGPSPTLRPWIKTHKLERLAARAGITYDGESLVYLRRIEKYILWAGRYPVPLAPPTVTEPRGFDYQIGVQDRTQFQKLYDLARDAYTTARESDSTWKEPSNVGNYRERESVWMATCTRWLRVVGPRLIDHAIKVANGDRGVFEVGIDTAEMTRHLTQPNSFVRLDPVGLPAEDFVSIVGDREGVGAETAQRWAEQLATMDATRDAALFLHSTPDADDRWFSRYVFFKEGLNAPSDADE